MTWSKLRCAAAALSCLLVPSGVFAATDGGGATPEESVIMRCGTPEMDPALAQILTTTDCAYAFTEPRPSYNPGDTYNVPVVVHVIQSTGGLGSSVTDARVRSQIDVLNEDYEALAGTPGEPGTNVAIHFYLATVDTNGNPTTGITRSINDTWYNDGGTYWNYLAWDTRRYLNIYVNSAGGGGVLGYTPALPQQGVVGLKSDRVVIYWQAFGRPSELSAYSMGRTTTHEVGHYLGLWHTFQGGCATAAPPGCYSTGDVICDTNPEQSYTSGCPPSRTTCSLPAPYHNYMDYSTDVCMNNFTVEQMRRLRCTLTSWRLQLYTVGATEVAARPPVRVEGLELRAASPNPFAGGTDLSFVLPADGVASIVIYDQRGRLVRTIARGEILTGEHAASWDGLDSAGRRAAPGVYFARLEYGGDSRTTKLVLGR